MYKARVVRLETYGAFVELEGLSRHALLHVSQMSNVRVNDPSEVVGVGDPVQVKVISADPDSRKVSVTMRNINQSDGTDADPMNLEAEKLQRNRTRGAGREQEAEQASFPHRDGMELGAVLKTSCPRCGGIGHMAYECFVRPGQQQYALITLDDSDMKTILEAKRMATPKTPYTPLTHSAVAAAPVAPPLPPAEAHAPRASAGVGVVERSKHDTRHHHRRHTSRSRSPRREDKSGPSSRHHHHHRHHSPHARSPSRSRSRSREREREKDQGRERSSRASRGGKDEEEPRSSGRGESANHHKRDHRHSRRDKTDTHAQRKGEGRGDSKVRRRDGEGVATLEQRAATVPHGSTMRRE